MIVVDLILLGLILVACIVAMMVGVAASTEKLYGGDFVWIAILVLVMLGAVGAAMARAHTMHMPQIIMEKAR